MGRVPELSPSRDRVIVGTCCIPWTADYRLDESLFRKSICADISQGTKNLYLFGTAGEGHAVSDRQFQEITRIFVDAMKTHGGAEPMIGLISLSLAQVIERIEWAITIGVRSFQLSLPSWGTCTEAETFTFFERVCTRFPQCEFLHYNVRRSGRLLGAAEYGRLSAAFENLVAAKLAGATGSDALAIHQAAPRLKLLLTEKAFAEGWSLGVPAGFLISYASLNWHLAHRYYDAVVAGDTDAIATMRGEQDGVIKILRETVAGAAHMDGAFDLMFVKRHLPEFPLRLLPPYAGVSDEAYGRFIEGVRQQYPHWLQSVPSVPAVAATTAGTHS
jgi:dihydrodipicolinate synthase/N-acetylneuraminate lyase